jgi:hypothetical protein
LSHLALSAVSCRRVDGRCHSCKGDHELGDLPFQRCMNLVLLFDKTSTFDNSREPFHESSRPALSSGVSALCFAPFPCYVCCVSALCHSLMIDEFSLDRMTGWLIARLLFRVSPGRLLLGLVRVKLSVASFQGRRTIVCLILFS